MVTPWVWLSCSCAPGLSADTGSWLAPCLVRQPTAQLPRERLGRHKPSGKSCTQQHCWGSEGSQSALPAAPL